MAPGLSAADCRGACDERPLCDDGRRVNEPGAAASREVSGDDAGGVECVGLTKARPVGVSFRAVSEVPQAGVPSAAVHSGGTVPSQTPRAWQRNGAHVSAASPLSFVQEHDGVNAPANLPLSILQTRTKAETFGLAFGGTVRAWRIKGATEIEATPLGSGEGTCRRRDTDP